MIRILQAVVVLFALSFNVSATEDPGFDEICRIYTEAQNSSMSGEQLNTYIFDNIDQRVASKDAREAHDAIFNLEAAARYEVLKQSAELVLEHPWDCPAAKKLLR
jgi:hypothetical protein